MSSLNLILLNVLLVMRYFYSEIVKSFFERFSFLSIILFLRIVLNDICQKSNLQKLTYNTYASMHRCLS